jgi:hypothetical protein
MAVTLSDDEAEIVNEYEDKFRTFGLNFELSMAPKPLVTDRCNQERTTRTILNISHVPTCFVLREENESKYGRAFSILKITTILVKEIVDKIRCTRGGGLGILPKTILELLSSRACRGMNVITGFTQNQEARENISRF